MTGSSGVSVYTRDEDRYCRECDADFDVEVTVDPETHTTSWDCPNGHHNESTTWDDYEEDPDLAHDMRGEDA